MYYRSELLNLIYYPFGNHAGKCPRARSDNVLLLRNINDVSVVLGSVISRREMLEQSKTAAKILFPSCWIAELVISNRHQPSINCPLEVLMREIRNSSKEEITIKEVPYDFVKHLASVSEQQKPPKFNSNSKTQQLISFELDTGNKHGEHVANFVLSSTIGRIIRLEQLNDVSPMSPILQRRDPCCSQSTEASTWINRQDKMMILKLCGNT
ncbi:unnamed protein product [Trichobilharzia regenti]|nr:unnamed protein product [Trichobilharzia regenti]